MKYARLAEHKEHKELVVYNRNQSLRLFLFHRSLSQFPPANELRNLRLRGQRVATRGRRVATRDGAHAPLSQGK